MMKGKNLQPRLLYPARVSFRFDGQIKTFTDKQKLKEFSTTKPALQHAKRTSLGRKHKRRKRPTITNPKQLRKWKWELHIDNYLKCKWIKYSNQKT